MIYVKHKNSDLYSKFNNETGELFHISINESEFQISFQMIDESQIELLKTQLLLTSDQIDETVFETVFAPLKLKLS